MPRRLPDMTIIRDTREQQGWTFEPEEKVAGRIQVMGTQEQALDAGDYSLVGFEDQIRIERKQGFCELFGNMTPVEHKERFEREMEKLRDIPFKYLIVEANISRDVLGLSVPQMWKAPPTSAVLRWLTELEMEYGIRVIFAGDAGKRVARMVFDTFLRRVA